MERLTAYMMNTKMKKNDEFYNNIFFFYINILFNLA